MPQEPPPSPVFRWLAAGFLGGAATVGLVWSIATRPVAVPLEPQTPAPVRTLQPIERPAPGLVLASPDAPAPASNAPDAPDPTDATDASDAPSSIPDPTPAPDPRTTRIRINTATAAELDLLPGIGPALAQRIVESRRTEGPFHEPEDLERVPGIGPKTAERMTPYLRFD